MATPFVVVTENQEDEDACADVSAYMLGEVLELDYAVAVDNGNCIEVHTLIHFQDNGTATEITESGDILDSYSFQLISESGQCVMTTSDENCNAPVLVLSGDEVDMIHDDGSTVTLSESSVSYGCTDEDYAEYDSAATLDDGSCSTLLGCTWPDACNYNAEAGADDGSCEFESCVGCMDEVACNYDASATLSGACIYAELYKDCEGNCINDANEDGVCDEIEAIGVEGCTDPDATNYNPNATDDNGSCYTYSDAGCIISSANNYNPEASFQGVPVADYCEFSWSDSSSMPAPSQPSSAEDCADVAACNYNASASGYSDCDYCLGCTDSGACNYDAEALYDDGSCSYTGCSGCTNACSSNFDDTAVINDGSCDYANCGGCIDSEADNYDAGATMDDGSCQYSGCTYPTSCNYDPSATIDDGSCSFLSAAVIGSVELVTSATSLISADGEISVTIDSGDPILLEVTGLNGAADYAFDLNGTGIYGGIAPGFYSVTAVDASSCSSEAVRVIVSYDLCCDCGESDQDADGICDNNDNCTNRRAINYADTNNGGCIIPGCMNPAYTEYYSEATIDDGSCATLAVGGCTDPDYDEYNSAANTDDGSCQTLVSNCDSPSMDGYSYSVVEIGDQCWFAENLRTTVYADNSGIPEVTGGSWPGFNSGARCDYDNDVSNVEAYGRLYNWHAVSSGSGLCPSGWHVPTDGEWTDLENYINSQVFNGSEGTALKSMSGWNDGGNGTDDFGFSALPGGIRNDGGYFHAGAFGCWWSSSQVCGGALGRGLDSDAEIIRTDDGPRDGFSVRCLRDADEIAGCTDEAALNYDGDATVDDGSCLFGGCTDLAADNYNNSPSIDGYSYAVVQIGDQCWFAENLRTTIYADGSAIPEVTGGSWPGFNSGARCDYDDDVSNVETYGRLYNWHAVSSGSGLCPSGWHVPTDEEWTDLENYISSQDLLENYISSPMALDLNGTEGTALKSTSGWNDGGNGTDDFGFSALPGGIRNNGGYYHVGTFGSWWSSSQVGGGAWGRGLESCSPDISRNDDGPQDGFSVRCLRDAE